MASEQGQLHIFFLPFMAPGHMVPAIDMARLFAIRGVKSTIVTTPANIAFLAETIEIDNEKYGIKIDLLTVKFPSEEAGLPEGCENTAAISSPDMFPKFYKAIDLLQQPLANLMKDIHPHCLVADFFFSWANSTATKFGIPCLSFHGSGYFSQCIISNLIRYQPQEELSSESETFIVPGDLPHEIKLAMSELSPSLKKGGPRFLIELMTKVREAERACYGVIMNSFYELESAYVDYYEKTLGMKHWHIGPISLYFKKAKDGEIDKKGTQSSIDVNECMRWLDGKEPSSVIYICFGSDPRIPNTQLHEIAIALEYLTQNFILVVGKNTKEWEPDGFEERIKDHGLVIRGWAPQGLILDHQAIGAFMTHCGWNSILDGVVAGLPMVTWPSFAEQFYNEKLVTMVLKIGVPVGAKRWFSRFEDDKENMIHKEEIITAITKVMIGTEAKDMRNRAMELKDMAKTAIHEGGSSYSSLDNLIEELNSYRI